MVLFKDSHDTLKKVVRGCLQMGATELGLQFNGRRGLADILETCSKLNIPPAAISSIHLFEIGYFIH